MFILLSLVTMGAASVYWLGRPADLRQIQQDILTDYSNVTHISREDLATQRTDDVILLDIREIDEYAVSHLEGALRIDPDITSADLVSQLPKDLSGKTLIVYCSVGKRSTDLASRVKDRLMADGAANVVNLEGGIFGWHNDGRPLIAQSGPTEYVHPYDAYWKRWVKRKELTRYSPAR